MPPSAPSAPPTRPKRSRTSSSTFSRSSRNVEKTEVIINVYDLLPPGRLSSILYTLGTSLLHSGVCIRDREYAYGGHARRNLTGVYHTPPRTEPPGGTFRTSILQGFTFYSHDEIDAIIKEVSAQFLGTDYNLLNCNCNHFTSALVERVTGRPAPAWLNRAASIGVALPCVVPKDWINPPDFEGVDGDLLEEEGEESGEEGSLLGSDRRRSHRRIGDGGGEERTPPPRVVSVRDTSGRVLPGSERAPVPSGGIGDPCGQRPQTTAAATSSNLTHPTTVRQQDRDSTAEIMANLTTASKIHIVGSGVFGISTALWLARAGYTDITVFDMQDTRATGYDPDRGVDSASADWNKIVRFSYGGEIAYQRLAFEAAGMWEEWNRLVAECDGVDLPEGWRGERRPLWFRSGMLRISAEQTLGAFEEETLRNMEREGIRQYQFNVDDVCDVERAKQSGWYHKLDPTRRKQRLGVHRAVLDSTAGWVAAYRCCAWAQHLVRQEGVQFCLGKGFGEVVGIEEDCSRDGKPILNTADGTSYPADLIVVAGGGWTPSLLPEVSELLETTAGSVATIQIPRHRKDLWDKYAPENCPVISWGGHQGKDIYNFPRDEHGAIKIGYRHTKYTNFQPLPSGKRISVPKTAHVTAEKETNVPLQALHAIQEHIAVNLPDLAPFGLASTKLCWYTDSIDNSFVVDNVPGKKGIVVCSGGSGHGFKFLPILGREVVKILEGKETMFREMWKWRSAPEGAKRNGLEEGEEGPRVLQKQRMARPEDWKMEVAQDAKL